VTEDWDGWTPLHCAAQEGQKEIAELLVAGGADVNAKNKWGQTSLHDAILGKNKEIIELLIAKGADLNAKDNGGWTSLHSAAYGGNKEIAELLIAKGADVNAKDDDGETPLHDVAFYGYKEIAELLIDNGADVNAKNDRKGETPLHQATLKANKEIIELLIAKGADVNAKRKEGKTPLDLAITSAQLSQILPRLALRSRIVWDENGRKVNSIYISRRKYSEIADLLRKRGGKSGAADSIQVAASVGNIEAVKRHLAAGVDINAKSEGYELTPLHGAVALGHKEIAELLIAAGANLNIKYSRATPLDFAIKYKHPKIADLLRKHGGKTGEELKAEQK